jgi:DNA polymerase III epsilon subunit-like protein
MTWWDGRIVGLDLETTGTDPEEARIVTAAVVFVGGGQEARELGWVADPGVEIPLEAAEVHGFTTERAREEGRPAGEVVGEVLDAVLGRPDGAPLVVFSARYDLTVLDREARRHGLAVPDWGCVVDPSVIDKHIHKFRKGSRKLDAMCEHYKATLADAHEAASDALAACRLAWRMCAQGRVIRNVRNHREMQDLYALEQEWAAVRGDLPGLHAAQVRWAEEQAVGLAEYFRSQGNPDADSVRVEWPVVPFDLSGEGVAGLPARECPSRESDLPSSGEAA